MAAKSWEKDFRYPAIQASMKLVREEQPDELFDCSHSLCVPVANKPVAGWTPGKIFLIALVLGFGLLFAAMYLTTQAEKANNGQGEDIALLALGTVLGLSGMFCFFIPAIGDRFIMKILTGARGAALMQRDGQLLCGEVSHTDRSKMKISIDGDDYVLVLADVNNKRLLIEGVTARYLIHADDVTELTPFEFMNYVGAKLTFSIGDETSLSIAIARVSLLLEVTRQVPILFFLRKRIKNRILPACEKALGRKTDQTESTLLESLD